MIAKKAILIISVLAVALAITSCRSKRMTEASQSPPPQVIEYDAEPVSTGTADIPTRSERFTFEDTAQEVGHDFFVIVGSYSMPENAERASTILSRQGFKPVILLSETGMHRVCVNSYTAESEARMRVQQIRRTFPEYHDAWLLIRQR